MRIGLTGKAGCGKDTAADIIHKMLPQCERYSFASPIYELAEAWLGLTDGYYNRDIKEATIAVDASCIEFHTLDILIYDMFKDRHPEITPVTAKKCASVIITELTKDSTYSNNEQVYLVTSPRRILQVIGTEGFRNTVCDSFWVDLAPKDNVIISDVRFNNEAEIFDTEDDYVIEIVRDTLKDINQSGHSSEGGVKRGLVDEVIYNNSTINDLQLAIEEFIEEIA